MQSLSLPRLSWDGEASSPCELQRAECLHQGPDEFGFFEREQDPTRPECKLCCSAALLLCCSAALLLRFSAALQLCSSAALSSWQERPGWTRRLRSRASFRLFSKEEHLPPTRALDVMRVPGPGISCWGEASQCGTWGQRNRVASTLSGCTQLMPAKPGTCRCPPFPPFSPCPFFSFLLPSGALHGQYSSRAREAKSGLGQRHHGAVQPNSLARPTGGATWLHFPFILDNSRAISETRKR